MEVSEHNGVENYRGKEIKWEISEIDGSGFWRGMAAIVTPPAAFAPPAVKSVPAIPDRFNSEQEALETIFRLARGFVDSGMKVQEPEYTAQKNCRPLRDQRSGAFMVLCALLFLLGVMAGSLRSR
jgi:hypothetical protein